MNETTEETVTETNRLQTLINQAANGRIAQEEAAPQGDFASLIRNFADNKAHCERLEIEYRLAMERYSDVRNRLIEMTSRLTEPVAYVMQDQPGMAYVMHPPATGEKVGRMESTPLVLV